MAKREGKLQCYGVRSYQCSPQRSRQGREEQASLLARFDAEIPPEDVTVSTEPQEMDTEQYKGSLGACINVPFLV